jgi:hypothetical protein
MAQRTRKTSISVEELPQPQVELTRAEAEAAKGGMIYTPSMALGVERAVHDAVTDESDPQCIPEGCIWFTGWQ